MTDYQRGQIWVAMNKYEMYLETKVSTLNDTDISVVTKTGQELGLGVPNCRTCLEDILVYFKKVHDIYSRK